MWFSQTSWLVIQVIIVLLTGLPLFLWMQKRGFPDLKWRIIVPLGLGFVLSTAILEGFMKPQQVYLVEDGKHGEYRVTGDEVKYTFANGTEARCGRAPGGTVLVNDSKDTLALETIYYSEREIETEEGDWDYLLLVPPYSMIPMKDTWVHYAFKTAPTRIEVSKRSGTVRKHELRKLRPEDADNWYFFTGEVDRGQPVDGGQAAIYDGTRLVFEGTFEKAEVAAFLLTGPGEVLIPADSAGNNLKR